MLDNTAGLTLPPSAVALRSLSPAALYAVSFYLPEADPGCGPGTYLLQTLSLPLSLIDALPGAGTLPLTALLYPADPATGQPLTGGGYLKVLFAAPGPVTSTPAYYAVSLPATWTLNAAAQRWYSLVLTTVTYTAAVRQKRETPRV